MKKALAVLCSFVFCISLLTACKSSDSSEDGNSSSSEEASVVEDSSSSESSSEIGDSSFEPSDDTSAEDSSDDSGSGSDSYSDSDSDSGSDSGSDTGSDSGAEPKTESGSDSKTAPDSDSGSGSGSGSDSKPDSKSPNSKGSGSKAKKSVSNDAVDIKEYLYKDSLGICRYYLVVTNNSNDAISFKADGTAQNKKGDSIDKASMKIDVIGSHETSIGSFFFDEAKDVDKVKYDYTCEQQDTYKPVVGNLSVAKNQNDKNVTLVVTNNADIPAQFVEAFALFFDKNNKLICCSSGFVGDSDSEIKPGASATKQIDSYNSYDHVEVYITGRSTGASLAKKKDKTAASDNDFTVREFSYANNFGTYYYLAFTNNSKDTVSISSNAVAKDKNGNVLGSDDMSIAVLAPGETSIGSFDFYDVKDVDKVEYQTTYKKETGIIPVIKDLSADIKENKDNIAVTIENKGKNPAQFVQAYVVLFDKKGNVIYVGSKFVTDEDFEIKPGKKASDKIKIYDKYDHVEVFLTGKYLDMGF